MYLTEYTESQWPSKFAGLVLAKKNRERGSDWPRRAQCNSDLTGDVNGTTWAQPDPA